MNKGKKVCKDICKKFKVKKPPSGSRYGSGQGRCQTCDVWVDFRWVHMKDGTPATIDSMGWFCDCCNYRIRQKPRNKLYKEKLRETITDNNKSQKKEKLLIEYDSLNSKDPNDWIKIANEIKKYEGFQKCVQCKKNNHCWGNGIRCSCDCSITKTGSNNIKRKKLIPKEKKILKKKIISDEEFIKQFDSEKESSLLIKENKGNEDFFKDIKNQTKNNFTKNLIEHCVLLTQNYKKRIISKHNIELMEDMIDAYLELGTLRKICQETGLDESKIRGDFKNLIRVPNDLRQLVLDDKLIADPILSTEIAIYATDYFRWDKDHEKTKDVIKFAKDLAELFKNNLDLRSEFFATKDDYSKPVSGSTKKNNELKSILEDWPVKESKYEFNRCMDRTAKQYRFIVFISKDLDAARFVRRWEYEKGRRIPKVWASDIIDEIKQKGNAKEFVKNHSYEFND